MVRSIVLSALLFCTASASAFNMPIQNLFAGMAERSGMLSNDMTIEHALQRVAIKMNQHLPSEVDRETRLDKLTADIGKQLTYHYTLLTLKSNELNKAKFQSAMEPLLKRRLCSSDEMKGFLRNGISIMYVYRAIDVQPVASCKYSPADCGYKK